MLGVIDIKAYNLCVMDTLPSHTQFSFFHLKQLKLLIWSHFLKESLMENFSSVHCMKQVFYYSRKQNEFKLIMQTS